MIEFVEVGLGVVVSEVFEEFVYSEVVEIVGVVKDYVLFGYGFC